MMKSASPMTTGETASGTSRMAFKSALPRNSCLTSTIAHRIPKTVLALTATAAISRVIHRACKAAGSVTDCQTAPRPFWKVRAKTMLTGKTSSSARQPSARTRKVILAVMTRPPAVDQAQPEQYEQRDRKQHDGDRRGARRLSALYLPEDVDGGDLGLERLVARYEDHRAELAHGAGETQGRP